MITGLFRAAANPIQDDTHDYRIVPRFALSQSSLIQHSRGDESPLRAS